MTSRVSLWQYFYNSFAAVSCVVGEWNHWSGCAEQCKPTFRMRTRIIQQEPKNGGEPCPPLEEKAGCLEYATHEGKDCGDGTHASHFSLSLLQFASSSNGFQCLISLFNPLSLIRVINFAISANLILKSTLLQWASPFPSNT